MKANVAKTIIVALLVSWLIACMPDAFGADPPAVQEKDARLKWWRQARFGMFVHWGPVSLKGTEIGWSRVGIRRDLGRSKETGSIPAEVYDNLYKQFNPVKFNADEWVRIAKAAGMKYFVFTTKHHDGFSMFDSKLNDYKITNSPFKRDVVAELAEACHKAGLPLGFYYSPPDWHHPDYFTENHARYIKYLHGQVRELCTNYGKVDIIWFDGLGRKPKYWDAERLCKMIHELQPHALINNRCGLPGDYETPEQRVGVMRKDGRPWETCMTLGDQWAWKPKDNIKSFKRCIQTLVRVAGGDGNFLFNVGPMPDGRIEPRQVKRLQEMGEWLAKYGESIYGTRGGPFLGQCCSAIDCMSTRKGNRIYVHILDWPDKLSDRILNLPSIGKKVIRSRLLTGGEVELKQTSSGITIKVPKKYRQEIDTIVVLEIDGVAGEVPLAGALPASLTRGKAARASNVIGKSSGYSAGKAVDGNGDTRWATAGGTKQAWLEVDLGEPCRIGRATICEAFNRVRKFELQYKADGQWNTFYSGTRPKHQTVHTFKPVTAQHVRLNILDASEGPSIWEFRLLEPED